VNLSAARMIGGNNPDRIKDDFYPSPDEITVALLENWQPRWRVWEPACGDGAMCKVIERYGYEVQGSDLVDRGYGQCGVDFLLEHRAWENCIITNPPFNLSAQFIEHALKRMRVPQLALYLKSTYWHAAKRLPLFEEFPPSTIMPLTWRVDFTGGGQATLDTMWCIWDERHEGDTVYRPVRRPA